MHTMQNIIDAISLAFQAKKQITPLTRSYPQRTQRSYTPHLSFEPKPKLETQTSSSNPSPHTFKETTKPNSSLQNKPAFIPLQNSYWQNQTNNPYAKPFPNRCYRCGVPGHRSNECSQWPRAVGLIKES